MSRFVWRRGALRLRRRVTRIPNLMQRALRILLLGRRRLPVVVLMLALPFLYRHLRLVIYIYQIRRRKASWRILSPIPMLATACPSYLGSLLSVLYLLFISYLRLTAVPNAQYRLYDRLSDYYYSHCCRGTHGARCAGAYGEGYGVGADRCTVRENFRVAVRIGDALGSHA